MGALVIHADPLPGIISPHHKLLAQQADGIGFLASRASMMDTAVHDSIASAQHVCFGPLSQPQPAISGCLVVTGRKL